MNNHQQPNDSELQEKIHQMTADLYQNVRWWKAPILDEKRQILPKEKLEPFGDDTQSVEQRIHDLIQDEILKARLESDRLWENHVNAQVIKRGHHGDCMACGNDRVETAAREARIDELQNRLKVQFIPSHWTRLCSETNSWAKYVDRRIAQLNQPNTNKEKEL